MFGYSVVTAFTCHTVWMNVSYAESVVTLSFQECLLLDSQIKQNFGTITLTLSLKYVSGSVVSRLYNWPSSPKTTDLRPLPLMGCRSVFNFFKHLYKRLCIFAHFILTIVAAVWDHSVHLKN